MASEEQVAMSEKTLTYTFLNQNNPGSSDFYRGLSWWAIGEGYISSDATQSCPKTYSKHKNESIDLIVAGDVFLNILTKDKPKHYLTRLKLSPREREEFLSDYRQLEQLVKEIGEVKTKSNPSGIEEMLYCLTSAIAGGAAAGFIASQVPHLPPEIVALYTTLGTVVGVIGRLGYRLIKDPRRQERRITRRYYDQLNQLCKRHSPKATFDQEVLNQINRSLQKQEQK